MMRTKMAATVAVGLLMLGGMAGVMTVQRRWRRSDRARAMR